MLYYRIFKSTLVADRVGVKVECLAVLCAKTLMFFFLFFPKFVPFRSYFGLLSCEGMQVVAVVSW